MVPKAKAAAEQFLQVSWQPTVMWQQQQQQDFEDSPSSHRVRLDNLDNYDKGCALLQCSLAAFRDPVLNRLAALYILRVTAHSGLTCFTQIKVLSM